MGETAVRGTDWNGIVWDWNWVMLGGEGEIAVRGTRAELYCMGQVVGIGGSRG